MRYAVKQLSLFAILALLTNTILGQNSFVTKNYLNNTVQISTPSSLQELDTKTIANRFPNPNERPSVWLTDKEEFTSLKIIETVQDVADNEVGRYKGFHMTQMKKEPNLQWLGDGYKKINGKNVGFIKVIYTERNPFAYFFFTSLNGKLLLLTYNSPDKLWPAMEETAEKIVNSLKVD